VEEGEACGVDGGGLIKKLLSDPDTTVPLGTSYVLGDCSEVAP